MDLELGDFFPVSLADGRFGCAVVTDLKRSGVASRKTFIVGLTGWAASTPPTAAEAMSAKVFAQGLTRIEAITATGSQILGRVGDHEM